MPPSRPVARTSSSVSPGSSVSSVSSVSSSIVCGALLLAVGTGVAGLHVGCLDDIGDGGTSSSSSGAVAVDGGDSGTSDAEQACLDTVDAFAKAQVRCGVGDYTTERNQILSTLAGGDCSTVSIFDEAHLRSECLPSLAVIDCTSLANDSLDPSCSMQIIRN